MKRKIFSLLLCAILCVSAVWLTACTGTSTDTSTDGNPTVGTKIGNLCPSYELEVFDESGLNGTKADPSKSGKVTVINFWGTWCSSCVAELPYFDDAAKSYGDDVVVYAVHTDDDFNTAPAYVEANYKNSSMVFLKDAAGNNGADVYWKKLGGAYNVYPFTVILDKEGVISYTNLGAVPEETLLSEIDKALGK